MKQLLKTLLIYLVYVIIIALLIILKSFIFDYLHIDYGLYNPIVNPIINALAVGVIFYTLHKKQKLSLDIFVPKQKELLKSLGIIAIATSTLTLITCLKFNNNEAQTSSWIIIIIGSLLAVAAREILFLNILQKTLFEKFNIHISVLLSSLIYVFDKQSLAFKSFSLEHSLYFLLVSIILGYSYFFSKNILVSIAIHFTSILMVALLC